MTKTQVATQETNTQLPAFLSQTAAPRGSEEIGSDDLSIPRIELIQAMSPQKKKSNADKYIEGAEEGMAYNTLTNELYENKLTICPVYFRKEFLVWPKKRNADSGSEFKGSFSSLKEALEEVKAQEQPELYHPVETHQHFCLVFNSRTDTWESAVISMSSSKLKISKQLNSILHQRCTSLQIDRFANKFDLNIVEEKNSKGEFYNYKPTLAGYVDETTFKQAEELYLGVKAGERDVSYKEAKEKEVKLVSGHPEENLSDGEFPEGM